MGEGFGEGEGDGEGAGHLQVHLDDGFGFGLGFDDGDETTMYFPLEVSSSRPAAGSQCSSRQTPGAIVCKSTADQYGCCNSVWALLTEQLFSSCSC